MRPGEELSRHCSEKVRRTKPILGRFIAPRRREVIFAHESDVLVTRHRQGRDWLRTSVATMIAAMPIVRLVTAGFADGGSLKPPKTRKEISIEANWHGATTSCGTGTWVQISSAQGKKTKPTAAAWS
jgi:hypothetical protein